MEGRVKKEERMRTKGSKGKRTRSRFTKAPNIELMRVNCLTNATLPFSHKFHADSLQKQIIDRSYAITHPEAFKTGD